MTIYATTRLQNEPMVQAKGVRTGSVEGFKLV